MKIKKIGLIGVMITFFTLSISAQSLYFDIGLGLGNVTTEFDGTDASDVLGGDGVTETGLEMGIKLGVGPIANMPIYIVGNFSAIAQRFDDGFNYIQYNSYLIGPGVIIYPVSFIQVGASVGYSYVANQTDLGYSFYDSESGYAGSISAALDLGMNDHGLLIGVKYSYSSNTLETSGTVQEQSLTSIFIRYAYRNKE